MTKIEIEIEDNAIPDGYRAVRVGFPINGDRYLYLEQGLRTWLCAYPSICLYLIVEKIKPQERRFVEVMDKSKVEVGMFFENEDVGLVKIRGLPDIDRSDLYSQYTVYREVGVEEDDRDD